MSEERWECFWMSKGKCEPMPGVSLIPTAAEAITIARDNGEPFTFSFNDVKITVAADSRVELIGREFHRAVSGYITGGIGPYPSELLTPEEIASDRKIEAANEERRRQAQAAYEADQKKRRMAADSLITAHPLELADKEGWESFVNANPDGYGGAVISYAERWARLMQAGMANGEALEAIADRCSHEADIEGITGFMYGCAVGMLAKCWKHGEKLRRWHNLKTQIRDEGKRANDEGGVLNPAVLRIAAPR